MLEQRPRASRTTDLVHGLNQTGGLGEWVFAQPRSTSGTVSIPTTGISGSVGTLRILKPPCCASFAPGATLSAAVCAVPRVSKNFRRTSARRPARVRLAGVQTALQPK